MTEAPILTAKQRKSSLSAKKTKTKETIKNSLYTPYKQYWPCINKNQNDLMKEILDEYLPKLLPDKVKVPWSDLKSVKKMKRKKRRQKIIKRALLAERGTLECKPIDKNGLILGVNDVSKALENGNASHVLLSDDIEPKLLVQHIIDQAIFNKVPILVVSDLRNILKQKCGIASIALAFTNNEKYSYLQAKIDEMSAFYPVPKNHIHYNRLQNIKMSLENKQTIEDMETDINISQANITKNIKSQNSTEDKKTTNESVAVLNKSIYLIRTDKEKRVFIPEKSNDRPTLMESENLQFSINQHFNNSMELYIPLQVKRLKQNKNRFKNKVSTLKKQKCIKSNK